MRNTVSSESQWPGPASDTSNVLNSTPLDALLTGNGGTTGFSINYEKVPQAIADLEHAAKFFHNRAKVAEGLANIPAPGTDGVSINAVVQIGKWASNSGENNLAATLHAGARQLEDLAHSLREDLKTYLQVEELNIPKDPSLGLTI
jgi:hypothetical protein